MAKRTNIRNYGRIRNIKGKEKSITKGHRKILADIAVFEPLAFEELVSKAKKATA